MVALKPVRRGRRSEKMGSMRRWMRAAALKPSAKFMVWAESLLYTQVRIGALVHRLLTFGTKNVGLMGSSVSGAELRHKAAHARERGETEVATALDEQAEKAERRETAMIRLGILIAQTGCGLTTGGCDGLPGAAVKGFNRGRGRRSYQLAVGVRISSLNIEQPASDGLDLIIWAKNFFARLAILVYMSPAGVVICPGGPGTRLEEAIWLQLVQKTDWRVPVIFFDPLDEGHFDHVHADMEAMIARGFCTREQFDGFVHWVTDPREVINILMEYANRHHILV